MTFYHVLVMTVQSNDWFHNLDHETALSTHVCPFVEQEIALRGDQLLNTSVITRLEVLLGDRAVDSDWPVRKSAYVKASYESPTKEILDESSFRYERQKALREQCRNVTAELFQEAVGLIESGGYIPWRRRIATAPSFFVCPLRNDAVMENYEYVIKPAIEARRFEIRHAEELRAPLGTVNEAILEAIDDAPFVVADLTDSRPNCYYEIGYAHAKHKPTIILARENTERHFDISTHRWTFWTDLRNLKPQFDKELDGLLMRLGIRPA